MTEQIVTRPFCATCGSQRPEDIETAYCIPCANRGHMYRLITTEAERKRSLRNWMLFWEDRDFSAKEIAAIPTYQNLTQHIFPS